MTQKRSLGPHNSNSASGTDHLNVSEPTEDRNPRCQSPKNRERKFSKIEKSRSKILKIMKNTIWIFPSMLFVRYPWTLWGLGNISQRLPAVFFGRSAASDCRRASSSRSTGHRIFENLTILKIMKMKPRQTKPDYSCDVHGYSPLSHPRTGFGDPGDVSGS